MAKQIDNNVPLIRFEGFEDEWVEQKLKDIVEVYSGRDYKHLSVGDIPVYGTGGYMLSVDEALSYDQDAIGIGRKGTINKPYLLKCPFWTVDTLFYAVPREGYDLNFSFCIFQKTDWKKKDESTGVPSLSRRAINETRTFTPNENEQHRISLYFKELDRLIELHQHKHNKLVTLKQTMLQKIFPKNSATTPEIRFKGFDGDWVEKKIGDIGAAYSGLSGKTKEDFGHGTGRYITYMNVFSNAIADFRMTEAVEIDTTQNEVQFGDVFFTVSSETLEEVGMSSVWLNSSSGTYLNSFCFGFRPVDKIDPYFLAYILRAPDFRKSVVFLGQGISRYNISKRKTLELSIRLPALPEQQKIGAYLYKLESLILHHSTQLDKLKQIKSAFLEKMFV